MLWPFCTVLCPFCPSHKLLKFAGTVYDSKFIGNFEGLSGIKGRKGTFLGMCFPKGARGIARGICVRAWLNRKQVMIKFNQ